MSVSRERVDRVASTYAGGTPSRDVTAYYGGDIPWVKSGEVEVSAIYSTEETLTELGVAESPARWCEIGSTLIAMYGATAGKVGRLAVRATTNQAVLCVQPHDVGDQEYLYQVLKAEAPRLLPRSQGSGQPNLNASMIREMEIPWPQRTIRTSFSGVMVRTDRVIASLQGLAARKRQFQEAVRHDLLTGRRRFPEFKKRAGFRNARLGDHAGELTNRNGQSLGAAAVMGVVKGVGLIPMPARIRSADISRYLMVPPGAFAYNPMRLNIGSIARNVSPTETFLVSPDYVVFETGNSTLLPSYLDHLRRSTLWSRFVTPAGSGSVRVRIYFDDLAEMRIPLPSIDEQCRIVTLLDKLDSELAALETLGSLLTAQKTALMQRLLAGELTFPDGPDQKATDD